MVFISFMYMFEIIHLRPVQNIEKYTSFILNHYFPKLTKSLKIPNLDYVYGTLTLEFRTLIALSR